MERSTAARSPTSRSATMRNRYPNSSSIRSPAARASSTMASAFSRLSIVCAGPAWASFIAARACAISTCVADLLRQLQRGRGPLGARVSIVSGVAAVTDRRASSIDRSAIASSGSASSASATSAGLLAARDRHLPGHRAGADPQDGSRPELGRGDAPGQVRAGREALPRRRQVTGEQQRVTLLERQGRHGDGGRSTRPRRHAGRTPPLLGRRAPSAPGAPRAPTAPRPHRHGPGRPGRGDRRPPRGTTDPRSSRSANTAAARRCSSARRVGSIPCSTTS